MLLCFDFFGLGIKIILIERNILNLFLFVQDAVVIILDVGPSMCQAAPGHATPLETSVKAINMIIQRKVGKGR